MLDVMTLAWAFASAALAALLAFILTRHRLDSARLREEQLMRQELALLQERLAGREEEISRLGESKIRLETELYEQESALQDALQETAGARARIDVLMPQLERLEQGGRRFESELDELRRERTDLQVRLSELETELRQERLHHEEKLRLLSQAKEQVSLEFQSLAAKILDDNSQKFAAQNQSNLDHILQPLKLQLTDFRQKVEEAYDKEAQQRFSLAKEIQRLQSLNERISEDALNLTNALKGQTKLQGAWGEVILERVLERSGLVRGREYEVQSSFRDQHGQRFQPDVVVHLPDNKHVVVDSKVSLTAFAAYHAADSEEQAQQHLKQHLLSLRNHIRGLSKKQYQDLHGLSSLDFVLLFIPVEGAFSVAVQADAELFNEAFEQNIVLVSPSTLLATLRTIHNIWRYEYQFRNVQEIARQAGNLYDKFVGFVDDLDELGQRLSGAQDAWERSYNKLSSGKGNLVRRAEILKGLGARASKSMPEGLVAQAFEAELSAEDGEGAAHKVHTEDALQNSSQNATQHISQSASQRTLSG